MTQSVANRMRRQSRRAVGASSTAPITSHNPYSDTFVLQTDTTGPLWYAEDVRLPPRVAAGGVVDVAVDMVNERTVITPLNEDQCVDGLTNGLESEITIQPEWTEAQTVTDCLPAGGFLPSRRTHQFSFTAPTDPGTYTVSVEIRGTGSNEGGIETFRVVVPEDDDGGGGGGGGGGIVRPGPGDGDDSPDNGGGGDGPNPDGPLFNQTTIIGVAAVVTGIAALALS